MMCVSWVQKLTKSGTHPTGGQASLSLDNMEAPFAGGVKFTAMPPSKRYCEMDQLSGGEKTVAALALLFAIHRCGASSVARVEALSIPVVKLVAVRFE